jgi:hypothetical protein
VLPRIYAEIAQGTEDIARSATELEEADREATARVEELDPDRAAALQRVSTTKGISVDKALLIRAQAYQHSGYG